MGSPVTSSLGPTRMILKGSCWDSQFAFRPQIVPSRTCSDEAIPRKVLSRHHRFQQEAVLGILRYTEVRDTWRQEVSWKVDVDGDTVSLLFLEDDVLDGRKGRERWEFL